MQNNLSTEFNKPTFDLGQFSEINWARNVNVFKQGEEDNTYWATALAEEVGELAGAIKKSRRGFNDRELKKMVGVWEKDHVPGADDMPDNDDFYIEWKKKMKEKASDEAADIFIYLELFCTKNRINLWESIRNKFNRVSDEMGAPEYKI
jgi:NTP pyrophosphatase (non-canonical NTP hydrolase)